MQLKYHKAYKAFYLVENGKFKRPFVKVDIDSTKEKMNNLTDFSKIDVLEIADEYVVLSTNRLENNVEQKIKSYKTILLGRLPLVFLNHIENLFDQASDNNIDADYLFETIADLLNTDKNLNQKAEKLFYFTDNDIEHYLNRFLKLSALDNVIKKDIGRFYPSQFINEKLPLNYRVEEMFYIFYFIIAVELMSNLK